MLLYYTKNSAYFSICVSPDESFSTLANKGHSTTVPGVEPNDLYQRVRDAKNMITAYV